MMTEDRATISTCVLACVSLLTLRAHLRVRICVHAYVSLTKLRARASLEKRQVCTIINEGEFPCKFDYINNVEILAPPPMH